MTIASEIARIQGNIADAYNACAAKGATMPVTNNSASLANTIDSITAGGGDFDYQAVLKLEQAYYGGELQTVENVVNITEQSLDDTMAGTRTTYNIAFSVTPAGAVLSSKYYDKYLCKDIKSSSATLTSVPVGTDILTTASASGYITQTVSTLVNGDETNSVCQVRLYCLNIIC